MLSGPSAFCGLTPDRVFLTLIAERKSTWSVGVGLDFCVLHKLFSASGTLCDIHNNGVNVNSSKDITIYIYNSITI